MTSHNTQVVRVSAAPASDPGKHAVLIVDDEEPILRAYERLFRSRGYDIATATSGDAAIEAIMQRRFDVVVSDINMPGMSGVDLLQVVRAYDLDLPVILMTGVPTVDTAIQAVDLGALQYLPKPVDTEALLRAVARGVKLHRIALAKREAAELHDKEHPSGDLTALGLAFDRALGTMWMAFQPIVDAQRRRVFAYEALMRANEPTLPNPGTILAAAEELGRVHDLGRHIRKLTAHAFAGAPPDALLFVNLHTQDLLDDELFAPSSPLSSLAHRVVLEITERASLDGVRDVQRRAGTLRELGYRIAIDDLGAGYAGLSSFVALEPEFVKLDMSLVRGVHESHMRQRVIRTMTAMCMDLDMRVIAEGIEVAAERDGVRQFGCDLLQGYFFAKPGPPFPSVDI